ncbi:hypothetical protein ILYODFUR_000010 [Ilyodon furcidens]|uniref:Uncharacterized protein n=1 Tax=Ilyodon furcidens TaxID=33524 RepID=A0ABV0U3A3_9TELE
MERWRLVQDWIHGFETSFGVDYETLALDSCGSLAIQQWASGTWSPGEVELTVGQTSTMLNDSCLSCVKLCSRTVESQNLPFLYHHQTSPTDLKCSTDFVKMLISLVAPEGITPSTSSAR